MRPWFGVLRKGREVVILGGRSAKAVRPLFFVLWLDLGRNSGGKPGTLAPKGKKSERLTLAAYCTQIR